MSNLNQKYEYFKRKLENRVDELIEEYGYEVVNPNGLEPVNIQLSRVRQEIIKKLLFEDYDFKKGIQIAWNLFPHFLNPEDWSEVKKEFIDGFSLIEQYLEKLDEKVDFSGGNKAPMIYQIMNISDKTLHHICELFFFLIKQEDYEQSYEISVLFAALAPDRIEGWLGVARSLELMGDYRTAIEYYKHIHEKFENNPAPRVMAAWAYLKDGDTTNAKYLLEKATEKLCNRPELIEICQPVINKINSDLSKKKMV
jgi:tetratricopeptide (TPR) repeat protein